MPVLLVLSCWLAAAQQWEIGAAAGYGIYRNASIFAAAGVATAGFRNRFIAGAVVTHHMYDRISGEFRYTYHDGDPFLSAAKSRLNVQGQSHSFHYDVLFQFRKRAETFRPYVAVGPGAKLFVVSGPVPAVQPLSGIGTITAHDQARFLLSAGAGFAWRWREHLVLRVDFRDYISPFPKKLLAPAEGATGRGIFHQFTPIAGIGYAF